MYENSHCLLHTSIRKVWNCIAGALKATSNRGLQPAMDHILENEGNPVPDISAVTSSSSGPGTGTAGGDEDDDDAEALQAVYGAGGGSVDAQAKVRFLLLSDVLWTSWLSF